MEQVIGESVKETNRVFIKDYTQHYCKAITENYKLYHIDSMERMLAREGHESIYAANQLNDIQTGKANFCLLYTSPSPRDRQKSRMPSSA